MYDLAGFSVGIVDNANIIDGSSIGVGDVIIGIESTGPHSNGYSLIRKILTASGLAPDDQIPESGKTVAEALLAPTRIYVKTVLNLLRDFDIKGMPAGVSSRAADTLLEIRLVVTADAALEDVGSPADTGASSRPTVPDTGPVTAKARPQPSRSTVFMWGAYSGLCLPRRRAARALANRPRILSEASTTNQLREISLGVGLNVFMAIKARRIGLLAEGQSATCSVDHWGFADNSAAGRCPAAVAGVVVAAVAAGEPAPAWSRNKRRARAPPGRGTGATAGWP